MDTVNQLCLASLPGYAPRGTPDRARQAQLSLAELDTKIGAFIIGYNQRLHSETGQPPQARWRPVAFCRACPSRWSSWTCCC